VKNGWVAGVLATCMLCACVAGGSTDAEQVAATSGDVGLAGTAWELVKIQFMDDSAAVPDAASKYSLEFLAEGRVAIRADCNRGAGTWQSASPGRLEFGPIAATRALCPPGSIADTYLAQFEWVRSYLLRGGHLFLATMADGAIVEFRPAAVPRDRQGE